MNSLNDLPRQPRNLYFYAKKILSILFCISIIKISKLTEVMLRSKNVIISALWISYFSYAVFFAMWMYTAFLIQPKYSNWSETHKHLVYGATGAASFGGLMWIIAVWPTFHIWTLPLGVVVLVLFLDIVALIPSNSRKVKD